MKIKTTVRCHYTPVQWLKLKRLTLSRVDQAVGALELLHIAWGNVKWYNVFQKHLGSLLKSYTHTTYVSFILDKFLEVEWLDIFNCACVVCV